ncbi:hypothetical protein [Angustibacter aerolatus]
MRSGPRTTVTTLAVAAGLLAAGCSGGGTAPGDRAGGTAGAPTTSAPATGPSSGQTPATASGTASSTASATASTTASATASPAADATAAGRRQLPRGGTTLFPRYRLVGYSGAPGSKAFGRLGVGDLDERVDEIERRARPYADGRTVLPVLELITVVATGSPGAGGDYSQRVPDATIARYLKAARRHKALLLLDVQPGRADFLPLVKDLRPWLEQPDVGLALDPEWAVGPKQVPGRVFGRTTGAELDGVAAYLDGIVRAERLPQKVMVFHQVAAKVVREQSAIRSRPGVAVIKSVDGIGSRSAKTDTWRVLVRDLPRGVRPGFKLFYVEDARHGKLMTPKQVLGLRPKPDYVLYE